MITIIGEAETRQSPSGQRKKYLTVQCECGKVYEARKSHVVNDKINSCGCLVDRNRKTHGMSKTHLYTRWMCIKQRCYDVNAKSYLHYGAKGVTMCDEWLHDFVAFHDWALSNGFSQELTIDRVNNHPQYCPEHCQWVSLEENIRRRDECKKKSGLQTLKLIA